MGGIKDRKGETRRDGGGKDIRTSLKLGFGKVLPNGERPAVQHSCQPGMGHKCTRDYYTGHVQRQAAKRGAA